jgi:hypothetical protein
MRIELSSWQTVDLSLKRRRKRPANEKNEALDRLVACKFMRNQRLVPLKKARVEGMEDVSPLLVLTSQQKITVVGNQKGALSVSPNRQFSCRPGASFLATNEARVAAVLETKNDLVFALQKENTRLSCWSALTDPEDGVSTALGGSAVSLDVMPWNIPLALGTLQGSGFKLFVAAFDQSESSINLKTFSVPGLSQSMDPSLRHIATLGQKQKTHKENEHARTGKRKATIEKEDSGLTSLVVVQLFASTKTLYIVRHDLPGIEDTDIASCDRRSVQVFQIPFALSPHEHVVTQSMMLIGDSQSEAMVSLSYRTKGGRHCFLTCSVRTGRVLHGPFDVDQSIRKLVLINPSFIAGQTGKDIIFIDASHGATLQKCAVPDAILESERWCLLGFGSKQAQLVLLLEKEAGYFVASANLSFRELQSSGASLASKLSLSLDNKPVPDFQGALVRRQTLSKLEGEANGYDHARRIKNSLEMLDLSCAAIESDVSGSRYEGFVASSFARALDNMIGTDSVSTEGVSGEHFENPQDSHMTKPQSMLNGVNGFTGVERKNLANGRSDKKKLNGHTAAATKIAVQINEKLQKVPSDLVTKIGRSAIRMLMVDRDLGCGRNEARSVLRKAIRSTKAPARRLFDSFEGNNSSSLRRVLAALERREKEESTSYSPVELLFDIFNHCSDVSERHMIVGVQYLLRKAAASDVVDHFERTQPLPEENRYRKLCDQYRSLTQDEASSTSYAKDIDSCSSRIVLAATEALLAGILTYSDCNEALLRRAVIETLSRGDVTICLQVIFNVRQVAQRYKFDADTMKRAFLWTSTLCEQLRSPHSTEESALLEEVENSVSAERVSTNTMLRIQDALQAAISEAQEAIAPSQPGKKAQKQKQSHLPPYQLERLVF